MIEFENENRKMREPLEAARRANEELRQKAENYERTEKLYKVEIISFAFRKYIQLDLGNKKTIEKVSS
jgi:hypothetical protein